MPYESAEKLAVSSHLASKETTHGSAPEAKEISNYDEVAHMVIAAVHAICLLQQQN